MPIDTLFNHMSYRYGAVFNLLIILDLTREKKRTRNQLKSRFVTDAKLNCDIINYLSEMNWSVFNITRFPIILWLIYKRQNEMILISFQAENTHYFSNISNVSQHQQLIDDTCLCANCADCVNAHREKVEALIEILHVIMTFSLVALNSQIRKRPQKNSKNLLYRSVCAS